MWRVDCPTNLAFTAKILSALCLCVERWRVEVLKTVRQGITSVSRQTVRAGATVALVLACTSAFAQKSGTIPPAGTVTSKPAISMDTRSFFPQVKETISPRRIEVPNPTIRHIFHEGVPNGMDIGGVGGSTRANQGAMFPGIGFTGYIPADPQIAVSKTHIVQVVNTTIAFYTKKGVVQFKQDMGNAGFFSGIAGPFVFDPKVFFDKFSGRFFVVSLDQDDTTKTSAFLIAVSDDGDPNGTWKKYRIDNKATLNSNDYWLDYEGWGFNKDAIVATGNMFPFAGGNVFVQAFVMKKSELLAGGTVTATKFNDTATFTIQVAKSDENTSNFIYGCSLDSNSAVRVYAWRNLLTTPEMVFTTVTVPSFSTIGAPPSSGGASLDSLSGRLVDATYRTGSLLTAHTTRAPSGNTRSQCTWYEFRPNNWPTSGAVSLAQAGNVALPGDAWAFIPGINKNKFGDIGMMFTRSSVNIIADIMVTSRKSSDPPGQMGPPVQLGTSDKPYRASGRWGDYGSVCVDPSDDFTFWGNNMKSRTDGLWVAEILSWTLTTDSGGGGGGGTKVLPDAVAVLEGTYASGNLVSLKAADGSTYNNNTVKKPDGGYATAVQTSFTLPMSKALVGSFVVTERVLTTSGKSPTGSFYMWNWTKSQWDIVKSNTLTAVAANYTFTVTNITDYVSAGRKVTVMVRALDPIKRSGLAPAPFTLKTDLSQLNVTTK